MDYKESRVEHGDQGGTVEVIWDDEYNEKRQMR